VEKQRYMSLTEAALYIGIAPKTLYNRLAGYTTKPFPVKPKRVGGRIIFDREKLDAYMSDTSTPG
jgi:predicted DNA-binding transcriptional regulator AlpA